MDPEWKKQNLDSSEAPGAGAPQPAQNTQPQPPSRPGQPNLPPQGAVGSVNPDPGQLAGAYGQPPTPGSPKRKFIIIGLVALVLLVIASAATYFLLGTNDQKASESTASQAKENQSAGQKNIKVPSDWKTIDTKLGFTVKAPPNWSDAGSVPTNASLGNFTSKTVTISEPGRDTASIYGNYVAVSTQSLKNSKSQSKFEQGVTDKKTLADGLGVSKDQLTLTSTKLDINGKRWLRTDVQASDPQASGKFFETALYYWVGDHAIGLYVLSNKQSGLDKLANSYLLPMAASVELN